MDGYKMEDKQTLSVKYVVFMSFVYVSITHCYQTHFVSFECFFIFIRLVVVHSLFHVAEEIDLKVIYNICCQCVCLYQVVVLLMHNFVLLDSYKTTTIDCILGTKRIGPRHISGHLSCVR